MWESTANSLDMYPIHIAVNCSVLKIIKLRRPCMYISEYVHAYGIIQNGVEYTPTHSPMWERKGVFIAFRLRRKEFWFVVLISLSIKIRHWITYEMRNVRHICIYTHTNNLPSLCGIILYNGVLILKICSFSI